MTGSLLAAALVLLAVLGWPPPRTLTRTVTRTVRLGPPTNGPRPRRDGEPGQGRWLDVETVLALLDMTAAAVRAGAEPALAWRAALDVVAPVSGLPPVALLDPAQWLAALATRQRPTQFGVAAASLAAAWRLAQRTGAPLAQLLDSVGATLRAQAEADADVEAALAGPRATARLLLGLPLVGLALGALIGAHPARTLVTTAPGRVCGLLGVAFAALGYFWIRRLVASAASAGDP